MVIIRLILVLCGLLLLCFVITNGVKFTVLYIIICLTVAIILIMSVAMLSVEIKKELDSRRSK